MPIQTFQVGIKALLRNDKGQILMVHIPEWSGNAAHWDLPCGRIDKDENFLDTLKRELKEELGVTYIGQPKQLTTLLTSITIPVGVILLPLIYIIYEVDMPTNAKIQLDPDSTEDDFKWFSPIEAADKMSYKFTPEFCSLVRGLN